MDNQDNRQSKDEKVTIPVAAKALNVSTKTVHRYIEKGLLTKVKEGTRVYVLTDQIRTLRDGQGKIDKSPRVHEKGKFSVDRTHYEGLLTRLGQLEVKQQLLLEYKTGLEAKNRELLETRERLTEAEQKVKKLEAEVDRLKKSWWKRLFSTNR